MTKLTFKETLLEGETVRSETSKSEHKQLAVNARRSPAWIASDHPVDEIANFLGAGLLPIGPVALETNFQYRRNPPTDNCFRGDQEERLLPT